MIKTSPINNLFIITIIYKIFFHREVFDHKKKTIFTWYFFKSGIHKIHVKLNYILINRNLY